jgi:thioredoxin-related protein
MKLLILTFVFIATWTAQAQKGIQFMKTTNLNVAVNAAKQQNKILFVEAYAPDCHVCSAFKGTFAQPQVGALYNAQFVNFQLDMNNPENFNLLKQMKININATPTFLFFDPKTMKVVQAKSFGEKENSVINVNSIGQKASNPAEFAQNFAAKFKSGDRNPAFLLNYAQYARIMGDTVTNVKVINEYAKILPTSAYFTQSTLNVLQTVMMNHDNVLFDYYVNHIPAYSRAFDANLVRMIYENVFQIVMTSSQANQLNVSGIAKLKDQMKKAGIEPNSIVRRTWMVEAAYLFKVKKANEALKVIQNLLDVLPNAPGPKEYQFLCDFVKGKTKDKKALKFAQSNWCKFGLN